jgi:hypothetical protein
LFFAFALVVFCVGTPQAWAALTATTTTLILTSGGNPVASGGSVTAGSMVTLTAGVSAGSAQLTTGQVNFCEEMLRFDLENEAETIKNYRQRVKQAEALGHYALAEQLRKIIAQEREHQHDLATALGMDVPKVLEGGA